MSSEAFPDTPDWPAEWLAYLYSFNHLQDYFACHEYLENLWLDSGRPEVLKGLIQAAVCLYHLQGGNVRGGRRMWGRAQRHLAAARAQDGVWSEIDIPQLAADMNALWEAVPVAWHDDVRTPSEIGSLNLPRVEIRYLQPALARAVADWSPDPD
ncbi:MAG: DUF309 domain-containing protein [Alicyclobacillus sp.]|nr:DUF309 domain-containing protein [Alicyclobacillus sp.]